MLFPHLGGFVCHGLNGESIEAEGDASQSRLSTGALPPLGLLQ